MKDGRKPKLTMSTASKSKPSKLSEDMENQIKDAFIFYTKSLSQPIKRNDLRSVLGNFAFTRMNGKEIEAEITRQFQTQDTFTIQETLDLITKKWFEGGGREAEADEMFSLFDRKGKGLVGMNEIKQVFNQYLDIVVSDADIQEFIDQADQDKDGLLNRDEFWSKMGYK